MKNQITMRPMIDGREADFRFEAPNSGLTETGRAIQGLTDNMNRLIEMQHEMLDIVKRQCEHIDNLYTMVDRLAPELDIIDTVAEDETEREMLTEIYLNRIADPYELLDAYKVETAKVLEQFEGLPEEDARIIALRKIRKM